MGSGGPRDGGRGTIAPGPPHARARRCQVGRPRRWSSQNPGCGAGRKSLFRRTNRQDFRPAPPLVSGGNILVMVRATGRPVTP